MELCAGEPIELCFRVVKAEMKLFGTCISRQVVEYYRRRASDRKAPNFSLDTLEIQSRLIFTVVQKTPETQTSHDTLKKYDTEPLVVWAGVVVRSARSASAVVVLLPQSRQPLLLGMRIDVCTNDKGNDVEEWHPRLLGKELLRKRQGYW